MGELLGIFTDTPVPTILVVAGVIFIFFSMGGRLSAGEIPAQQQRRVGVIGFALLIVGIILFAVRRPDVPTAPASTLLSTTPSPASLIATTPPTEIPTATSVAAATPVPATATPAASATAPQPTAEPTAQPVTDTPEPAASASQDAPQAAQDWLLAARSWPTLGIDRFTSSSKANWVPIDGNLDSRVALTFNNRFKVAAITNGQDLTEEFFNEAETFDAPGDFYLSIEAVGEQTGCYYGLTFRGTLSGDHYVFFVGEGSYGVFNPKAQKAVISFTRLPATAPVPTHLEIIAQNDLYRIYADGIYLNEFRLDEGNLLVQGRRVGLYTFVCHTKEEGQFTFDNFELRQP